MMASSMASKRVPLVRALEKLLAATSAPGASSTTVRPLAVAGSLRGYNTGAQLRRYDRGESDEDNVREYEDRRRSRDYAVPGLFSGSCHFAPCCCFVLPVLVIDRSDQ